MIVFARSTFSAAALLVAAVVCLAVAQDTSVPCTAYNSSVMSQLRSLMSATTPPLVQAPRCAFASRDFQALLRTVMLSIATGGNSSSAILGRQGERYPLQSEMINVDTSANNTLSVDRCTLLGQAMPFVVISSSACCVADHLVSNASLARAVYLAEAAARRLDSFLDVLFVPDTVPVVVPSATAANCQLTPAGGYIAFRNPNSSNGIILSLVPHPQYPPWVDTLAWAIPCATDALSGRPFVTRVNLNPLLLDAMSDSVVVDEIQRQLLHVYGLQILNVASVPESGLGKRVVYWRNGTALMGSQYGCDPASPLNAGIPMDDELYLVQNGQLAPSAVGAHFEPRVVNGDIMSAGSTSRDVSLATKAFFDVELAGKYWTVAAPRQLSQSTLNTSIGPLVLVPNSTLSFVTTNFSAMQISYTNPARAGSPAVGCGVLHSTCNTSAGGRDVFCFPPDINASFSASISQAAFQNLSSACGPDLSGFSSCSLAASYKVNGSAQSVVPSLYGYFPLNASLGGLVAEADYCPQRSTWTSCASPIANDLSGSGSSYGANSRCVLSSVRARSGAGPAVMASVRCFTLRCPLGLRVEFVVSTEPTWYQCPLDGSAGLVPVLSANYAGNVVCPAASVVCSSNLTMTAVRQTFFTVAGYSVEYTLTNPLPPLTTDQTLNNAQAIQMCAAVNASLAFLPDSAFAAAVMQTAATGSPAYFASASLWWVGATSTTTWLSWNGYTMSTVNVVGAPTPTGCFALNASAFFASGGATVTVVEVPCSVRMPVLCTRPWSQVPSYPCPAGTQCHATAIVTSDFHRTYIVPLVTSSPSSSVLTTRPSASSVACPSLNMALFDFGTTTDLTVMSQILASVATQYGTSIQGMWTNLSWDGNIGNPPLWSRLCSNFPAASTSVPWCFVLVASTTFQPLLGLPDCGAAFPALCYRQNNPTLMSIPGQIFNLRMFQVPVQRSTAESVCATYTNGFLAPGLDDAFVDLLIATSQGIMPAAGASSGLMLLQDSGAIRFAHIGVKVNTTNGTMLYTNSPNASFAIPAQTLPTLRPVAGTNFSLLSGTGSNNAVLFVNSSSSLTATWGLAGSLVLGVYICASFQIPISTGTCVAGKICDDGVSDHTLYMSVDAANSSTAAAKCYSLPESGVKNGTLASGNPTWPLLYPTLVLPDLFSFVITSFGYSSLTAVWVGLRYNATNNSFYTERNVMANATYGTNLLVVPYIDMADTSLTGGKTFSDGACIALKNPMTGTLALQEVACSMVLPFICATPLFKTWPANFRPYVTTNLALPSLSYFQMLMSFAVVTDQNVTYATATRLCQAAMGDVGFVMYGGSPCNVSSYYGNIFDQLSLSDFSRSYWIAGSGPVCTPTLFVNVNNAFSIDVMRVSSIGGNSFVQSPRTSAALYSMNPSVNNLVTLQLSNATLPFICEINTAQLQFTTPAFLSSGTAGQSLSVTAPRDATGSTPWSIVTNTSQFRVSIVTNMTGVATVISPSSQYTCPKGTTAAVSVPLNTIACGTINVPTAAYLSPKMTFKVGAFRNFVMQQIGGPTAVPVYPCLTVRATTPLSLTSTFNTTALTSFTFTAFIPCLMPGMSVVVTFNSSAPTVATVSPSTVVLVQINSTRFGSNTSIVTVQTTAIGGIAQISATIVSCNVSLGCVSGTTVALGNMSSFVPFPIVSNMSPLTSLVGRSTSNNPLPLCGRSNVIGGLGIGLAVNPTPAKYTVQLLALSNGSISTDLTFSPSVMNVSSLARQTYEMACGVAGTFDVYAVLSLPPQSLPPATFLPIVTGTFFLQTVTFYSATAITVSFAPQKTIFFPGDNITFTVTLSRPIVQLRTVTVSITSQYITFPPSGSSVSYFNGLQGMTDPVMIYGTIAADVSPFVGNFPLNVTTNKLVSTTFAVSVVDSGATSLGPTMYPIGQMPAAKIVLVKRISLLSAPTNITVGGSVKSVQVWLPQVSLAGNVVVDVACAANTTGNVTSTPWTFMPSMAVDSAAGQGVVGSIMVSAANGGGGTNWPDILPSLVVCTLVINGPVDVSTAPSNFSMIVYPRAIGFVSVVLGSSTATTQLVRPGWTYTVVVQSNIATSFGRSAVGINLSSTVVGFTFKSTTLLVSGGLFGGVPTTLYKYSSTLAVGSSTARGTNLCFTVVLNDTEWYAPVCTSSTCCPEVAPLIKLSTVPLPPSFLFTQPVGISSAQTLSLQLNSLPRDAPVVANIFCVPDRDAKGNPIAQFSNPTLTWRTDRNYVDTPSLVTLNTTIVGLIPNEAVNIYVNASGAAELVAFPLQLFFTSAMEFVSMVQLRLSLVNFPGVLFVTDANSKQLMVTLSTAPFSDVTVVIATSSCLLVVPNIINFTNASDAPLSTFATVSATCPSELATLTANVQTNATNFNAAQNGQSLSFPILPLQNVTIVSQKSGLTLVSVTLFCNDQSTSLPVFVNVSQLPTALDATLALTLSAPGTTLYITPSRFAFSRAVSNQTYQLGSLACPQQFVTTQTTASLVVAGPPEYYQSGFSFRATLQPLVTFAVIVFPLGYVTVGTTAAYIAVTPNALPLPGTEVSLIFYSSCGSSVSLQKNALFAWGSTDVDAEIVVKLVATASSPSCTISLAVNESSSSHIFVPVAFNQTIAIFDQAVVIADAAPRKITSSQISASTTLTLTVDHNLFSPYPIEVVSTVDETPTAGVIVSSSIMDLSANGFLWALSTNPSAVTAVGEGQNLLLNLFVPNYAPRQDETLVFTITRFAMLRNETAISTNSTYTVVVQASEDQLSSVQNNFVGVAFALAAAVALVRGPALATHGPRIAILLDSGNCPIYNWQSQKQKNLLVMLNPFGQNIGSDADLGTFFGAAIFDIIFVLMFFALHWIIIFLAYAKRLDQRAATDRSMRYSMGALRFPSIEAFPVLYFTGVVCQLTAKVLVYSSNVLLRVFSGILLFCVTVLVSVFLFIRVLRRSGAEYLVSSEKKNQSLLQFLSRNRGKWVADLDLEGVPEQDVARQLQHLNMYGLYFEEYTEQYKYFCILDVSYTTVLSLASVYEPLTNDQCVIKFGVLCGLFAIYFIIVCYCRPYRRHIYNIIFAVISAMETAAISVSLAVSAAGYSWGPRAASISLITIGVLLYAKAIVDVLVVVVRWGTKSRTAKEVLDDDSNKFVVLDVSETTLQTYFGGALNLPEVPLADEDDKGMHEMINSQRSAKTASLMTSAFTEDAPEMREDFEMEEIIRQQRQHEVGML